MKRLLFIVLLSLSFVHLSEAVEPAREFRAAWFTTVKNIDWPKTLTSCDSTASVQQEEMRDMFDQLQAGHINVICFQARPSSDALYESSFEPWSPVLTGIRGMDPGYDPLAFAIREAHARGMELHAWVNPFRYERVAGERIADIEDCIASEDSDPIRADHPDWLLTYNNTQYKGAILDPGHPAARAYVVKVLMELVRNYDIDGLVMDDYFYPYGGTKDEDFSSQLAYQPDYLSVDDWRRACVNEFIRTMHDSLRAVKPDIQFGMSPFGIYSMTQQAASKYDLTLPAGIVGTDAWADLYCDPLAWVEGGWVDYLAPQLYWSTKAPRQGYETLCRWWCESVAALDARRNDGKQTHVYISHATYRFGAEELGLQIDLNRKYAPHNAPGSMFYNTNQLLNFTAGKAPENSCEQLTRTHFLNAVPTPRGLIHAAENDEQSADKTECCDTIKQDWQGSRFKRATLRQKSDN